MDLCVVFVEETSSSAGRNDAEKESCSGQIVDASGSSASASISSGSCVAAPDDDAATSAGAGARKHKKLQRAAASSDSPVAESHMPIPPLQIPFRKPSNPYSVYRSIKMKVGHRELIVLMIAEV